MTEFVSVVDTSKHQGPINHQVMRSRGVEGRILRITHGFDLDQRAREHFNGARDAGYAEHEIGWYPFINPKRGSAKATARFMLQQIAIILGHLDTFVMYDCESFINEPPLDVPAVRGRPYTDWLHEFDQTVAAEAPGVRRLMYTNAAFWNPWTLMNREFGHLDLLPARYPIYPSAATQADPVKLAAWLASSPKPPTDARLWAGWIMGITQSRPQIPAGWADWDGWQISAGFNRQGPTYGCASADLDLCIVKADAWARWTRPPAVPLPPSPIPVPTPKPQGEDELIIITNDGPWVDFDGSPRTHEEAKLVLMDDGRLRQLDFDEWIARGGAGGQPWTAEKIARAGKWTPPEAVATKCLFERTVIPPFPQTITLPPGRLS